MKETHEKRSKNEGNEEDEIRKMKKKNRIYKKNYSFPIYSFQFIHFIPPFPPILPVSLYFHIYFPPVKVERCSVT